MLIVAVAELGGWSHLIGSSGTPSNITNLPHWTLLPDSKDGYLGYTGMTGWLYWIAAWMTIGFGSIPAQDLTQRVLTRARRTHNGRQLLGRRGN